MTSISTKYIKSIINMVLYNIKTIFEFEFSFKIILSLILMPLSLFGLKLAMKITNYSYLTLENIKYFLINPISILIIILLLAFITMITLFEITTLIIIFDESYHKREISLKSAIKISFSKLRNIFKPRNISVAFLVLFLIPFLNIGLVSNVISTLKLPEFIMDYIESNTLLFSLYIIIYLFLLGLSLKWLYTLHYMVIEDKNFKEAKISSKKLSQGSNIKDKLKILFIELLSTVFFILFLLLGVLIIYLFYKLINNFQVVKSILITIVWLFIIITLILFMIMSNGISYAIISALFYKHKIDKKEKIIKLNYKEVIKDKKKNNKIKIIIIMIIVLSIIGGSFLTYKLLRGETNVNIESFRQIDVTAHRGASFMYPENTMAAFVGAKDLGADFIELDVNQTKDGQIVVIHDFDLKRVAGINKKVIEMNYDEISQVDVGSRFNPRFKDEKIPLLKDVIEFAILNNIRLNIELKPTGKEINFEQSVIDIVNKYNFKDRCVLTSQTYSTLERIKEIDSDIKTVYVMSIAIGDVTRATAADAFSIEYTNITENLVSLIHNNGKEIYAWTINTEEKVNRMIYMNVDNIITDNVTLCKSLITESRSSNFIKDFMQILE